MIKRPLSVALHTYDLQENNHNFTLYTRNVVLSGPIMVIWNMEANVLDLTSFCLH